MLCEGMPEMTCLDPQILYGISLDDLIYKNGRIKYASGRALRAAFQLPPDGRVCLVASVKDTRLEEFWARSYTDRVWGQIQEFGFEFVTGATFSVFEMHSRNGQIVNEDRNLVSVDFLAQAGVPVVPVFCEIVEEDLENAAQWLEERPTIRVVAGLAQSWKTSQEFARFLSRMKFLKNQVPHPLHFLIIGCTSPWRILKLFRELGAVTVTANIALRGVKGEWWDPDRREFVAVPEGAWGREDMIPSSIGGFTAFCGAAPRGSVPMVQ
jgi:hypothetical protein